ncbi:MAG: hypothetical protein V1708_04910 [Candidatus Micrarchaeota archaeon]
MDLRVMIKEMIKQGSSDAEIVANLKELGIENVEEAIAGALAAEEKEAPKPKPQTQLQKKAAQPQTEIETATEIPQASQTESQASEEEQIEGLSSSKSLFEEDAPPKDVDEALGGEKPLFESAAKPQGKGIAPKDDAQKIVSQPAGKAQAQDTEEPHGEDEVKPLFGELRKDTAQEKGKPAQAKPVEDEIPKLEITSIYGGEEKSTDIASMLNKAGIETPMRAMPQSSIADADAIERKLDDLEAAIKALTEVNRQILEANRETLFRLKTQKQ